MRDTTTVRRTEGPPPGGRLRLVVLLGGASSTHALPEAGSVSIGRSKENDIRIDDPSVSRRHAVLHVDPLRIEDLGSANGTRLRGGKLAQGAKVDLQPGDALEIGDAVLVIQREAGAARLARLLSHDYFEARLEDECSRAERGGIAFAVLRLHTTDAPASGVQETISAALRPGDVLATYGPGEYEALLVDAQPDEADASASRLRRSLAPIAPALKTGLACFPRDAHSPGALLAHANGALRGSQVDSAPVLVATGAMERLRSLVTRVASGSINVVILGETGVGKGVLAEEIHRRSPRPKGPFVCLNCAGFSEPLLESELFGHEKGAFTGAARSKPGLIETADGGTLFLDEIGEMPLAMQAKLLKVLEDREVRRVGGLRAKKIDVRILSATNRDLEDESRRGAFRADLWFRLNGIALTVPPLRERADEIAGLARGFLAQIGAPPDMTPEALAALQSYSWPGNIRELRNAIERAALIAAGAPIAPEHLPLGKVRTALFPARAMPEPAPADAEKERILDALAKCGGNQGRASALLGISRRTLVTRMSRYGLPRPRQ